MGKQNPKDTISLRDSKTFNTNNVPMKSTQNLELYTYCMIDFKECIVSYINIGYIPKISLLEVFVNENLKQRDCIAKISPILCDDVIDLISNKKTIGSICVSVAIPSDKILSEKFGLSEEEFDNIELNNAKSSTLVFKLSSKRNKSLFMMSNKGALRKFIEGIVNKYRDNICALKVCAKDENEKSQTYNILSYKFSREVPLYDDGERMISEKIIIDALKKTYENNKSELKKYSR